jgi:hypothetical protein
VPALGFTKHCEASTTIGTTALPEPCGVKLSDGRQTFNTKVICM